MSAKLPDTAPEASAEQYYSVLRDQIEHEDNLIGLRLSWFVTAQSFLFTAYAIVISNFGPAHPQWALAQMRKLAIVIPIVAMLTCLLIYAAIIGGLLAIRNLHRLYGKYFGPPSAACLPPVQGYRHTQFMGQATPLLLPLVFLTVWLVLLITSVPW